MSRILELLKNAKVEWKKLGEVCEIQRGRVISKKYLDENKGCYPVYSSQTKNNGEIGKIDTYDFDGEYATWTTDGAYAGTIFYRNGKFSITNICGLISVKDDSSLLIRFIVYWLQIEAKKYVSGGSGNPKLMSNIVLEIPIPIPPIELQKEIVRILDTFSELIAELQKELQAELTLREQQYEYYEKCLIFSKHFKIVKLKDICTVNQGLQIPINQRYKENGKNRYRYITIQFLKEKQDKQFYIENPSSNVLCNKDDILVTRTGNTGDIITGVEGCFHNNFFKVNCSELVIKRYLYHVLKTKHMNIKLKETASKGTVPDLPHNRFYELEIPLPSIEEQKKIVNILDKFSTITNDLNEGLPAEIKLREQQYEYYREMLLSFPH